MKNSQTKLESPRICLTGGWFSSSNIGDNAILLGIVDSLGAKLGSSFTVFTADAARVQSTHGLPALSPKVHPLKLLRAIGEASAVLYTGGTPFYDDFPHMAYFALLAATARAFSVPVFVFCISLREMSTYPSRVFAKFICDNAAYISARERTSVKALEALVGKRRQVHFAPDPALCLQPIPKSEAQASLTRLAPKALHGQKAIAICLRDFRGDEGFARHHYDQPYSRKTMERYFDAIAGLVQALILETDYRIVFLPMHTKVPDDDRNAADKVIEALSSRVSTERIHSVDEQLGPRAMKGILGLMDLVVGVRFHSLVLASSMGTPVLGIGYAPKNRAIMKLIEQEQYFATLDEISSEWLIERAFHILQNRQSVVEELRRVYANLGSIYDRQLTRVAALISSRG